MIFIDKGREPRALTEYKLQEHAYYDGCPKSAIRESLTAEQGNLCAYCMRRIDKDSARIEHWIPECLLTEYEKMDYRNLLGVCSGHLEGQQGRDDTCDAHKKDTPITVSPLNESTLRGIYYCSANGEIHSSDETVNSDLNDTLNLNSRQHRLPMNRKAKLEEVILLLKKRYGTKDWAIGKLRSFLDTYSRVNANGDKPEYLGIIEWYINKRINGR
ncbi:MAG: hypothetical protein Q4E64_06690 [Phascolarctobacterium sp.]|uniref:hypothetical protein n=1 Tax=Phascolarctobacterium sp. TaxID=2049039 RepID=UPI0026DCF520|nr:hypothetical protein [Phascolarctobacterium sp.]MDO4921495.1 hypothetical protein [Phascolarctobacterium sp.]